MITARIEKDGIWWGAHCDIAGVFTQGKSETEARQALAEAFEDVVNDPAFKVTVSPLDDGGTVVVEANDPGKLLAIALRYQREVHKLSLADVADKIGASSRNGYARYEQGAVPKLETLLDVLKAIAPDVTIALIARTPPKRDATYDPAGMAARLKRELAAEPPPRRRSQKEPVRAKKSYVTRTDKRR